MFIEVIISLRQVDTKLEELNLPTITDITHNSPICINLDEVTTFRPYIDAEGIPDYKYVHITFKRDEAMLAKYNYKDLQHLLNT